MELFPKADNASNSHPYEAEICAMLENPQLGFSFIDGSTHSKMSERYTWVETELQLKELLDVLSKERVFAVDTEQHSVRSFLGFTALIQVKDKEDKEEAIILLFFLSFFVLNSMSLWLELGTDFYSEGRLFGRHDCSA